jgi:magnesium chelatase subunit H
VITELRYIQDLITMMEHDGITPIPIFINGVEAHTIVRDLLTSDHEIKGVQKGTIARDPTYRSSDAVKVDAIVNTIGFPLVGGPAGSMEAGRNVAVAEQLLSDMNVPYVIASPLLLQSIPQWKANGVLGLQSVVLYSLPELDGAIDTVVLGGLVGDKIALIPERVRKLNRRVKSWVQLRRTPPSDRRIAVSLYGFPPNVGAVGTAALLDVPRSLEVLLKQLSQAGYDIGNWSSDPNGSGESLVAALSILSENFVVTGGAAKMQAAVDAKIQRAMDGDQTVAATLALPGGGLGGAKVRAVDVTSDELEKMLGKYMFKKVRRAWSEKDRGPGVSGMGDYVVAGLQLGNVWIFVQPLLGVEGDPMRLLFERDLTPHPQYCAVYEWMRLPVSNGGFGSQAVIHLG